LLQLTAGNNHRPPQWTKLKQRQLARDLAKAAEATQLTEAELLQVFDQRGVTRCHPKRSFISIMWLIKLITVLELRLKTRLLRPFQIKPPMNQSVESLATILRVRSSCCGVRKGKPACRSRRNHISRLKEQPDGLFALPGRRRRMVHRCPDCAIAEVQHRPRRASHMKNLHRGSFDAEYC
jgi:hypothetical protein